MSNRDVIKCEIRAITPELAARILAEAPRNRQQKINAQKRYAKTMMTGGWKVAQPILFDEDGLLLDGQNRLHAVIACGRTIRFLVVYGVPRDSFAALDCGVSRTIGDVLSQGGTDSADLIASACRIHYYILNECIRPGTMYFSGIRPQPQREQLVEWADRFNDDLAVGLSIVPPKIRRMMPRGWAIGLAAIFARKDKLLAEGFFSDLVSGESLSARDPVLYLRESLLRGKAERKSVQIPAVAGVVKAWNAVRLNVKVANPRSGGALVRYRCAKGDTSSEPFPKVE